MCIHFRGEYRERRPAMGGFEPVTSEFESRDIDCLVTVSQRT